MNNNSPFRLPYVWLLFSSSLLCVMASDPLDDLHKPPNPIPAGSPKLTALQVDAAGQPITNREAWPQQREAIERKWTEFLGEFPGTKCDLQPEVLATETLAGFTRQLVRYQVEPDT